MASPKKLKVKLLVDKEKKRVVFAESDKDFVDILLSFLTMPVGAIIRILNRQSSLGHMDKLYESIENLHKNYFNTEACKAMLLNPLNINRGHYEDLVLTIDDDINPGIFYTCQKPECAIKSFPFFSSVPKARCGCGEIMDFEMCQGKEEWRGPNGDGVFVKGMVTFLITDDLNVMPASTRAIVSVFEKLGIKDWRNIEERAIDFDADMLRDLLKKSLLCKHPLSGMYFQEPIITDNVEFRSKFTTLPKFEENSTREAMKLKAKFLMCKSSNKVVYVEAGDGFVDLLLSFLTFPTGLIVKLLDRFSSAGCVDNLYKSMESTSFENDCIKSDEYMYALLDPSVAPYFGCSSSLLPDFKPSDGICIIPGCDTCFSNKSSTSGTECCAHGVKHVSINEMNPKLRASKEAGGGYVYKGAKFMITDELELTPFSPLGCIQTLKKQNATFTILEEKEIDIGEFEALNLLKACLTSQNPLSDAFIPNKQRKRVKYNMTANY